MTAYRLNLKPGGIIPPAINVGVRLRKVPVPIEPIVCPPASTPSPVLRLPAGADNFADAAEIDITEAFLDRISQYTYVKDFTVEVSEPNYRTAGSADTFLNRTAWWKFLVPADKKVWVDVDTKLSFGPRTSIANAPANAWLNVYLTDVSGTPTLPDLTGIAGCDDVGTAGTPPDGGGFGGGPDALGDGLYAQVHNVQCDGSYSGNAEGTWFWIQIGDVIPDDVAHAFVLRMSVTDQATDDGLYPKWITDGAEPDA